VQANSRVLQGGCSCRASPGSTSTSTDWTSSTSRAALVGRLCIVSWAAMHTVGCRICGVASAEPGRRPGVGPCFGQHWQRPAVLGRFEMKALKHDGTLRSGSLERAGWGTSAGQTRQMCRPTRDLGAIWRPNAADVLRAAARARGRFYAGCPERVRMWGALLSWSRYCSPRAHPLVLAARLVLCASTRAPTWPWPAACWWGGAPRNGGFRERQQPGDKGLGARFGS